MPALPSSTQHCSKLFNFDQTSTFLGPLSRPSTAGYEYFMPPNVTVQASQLRLVNDSPHNLDRLGIYLLLMLMISATLLATRHGPQTSLQDVFSRMSSSTTVQLLPRSQERTNQRASYSSALSCFPASTWSAPPSRPNCAMFSFLTPVNNI